MKFDSYDVVKIKSIIAFPLSHIFGSFDKPYCVVFGWTDLHSKHKYVDSPLFPLIFFLICIDN